MARSTRPGSSVSHRPLSCPPDGDADRGRLNPRAGGNEMKWAVVVTTPKGRLELPLNGYFKTKREAEKVARQAEAIPETVKTEVVKQ